MTRREQIIKIAKIQFRERGYLSVSMRDLATILDIKAASLYNHITSKEEILAEIIMQAANYFTEEMNVIKSLESSSVDKLKTVIDHHIDITIRDPESIAILNNDWMHLEGKVLREFLSLRKAYEENLRTIIMEGVQKKEINPQNIEIILFSLLSTLRQLHSWYSKQDDLSEDQFKEDIPKILLNGMVSST